MSIADLDRIAAVRRTARPTIDPADEAEFIDACERFQEQHGRRPQWREVLALARSLGYRRPEPRA